MKNFFYTILLSALSSLSLYAQLRFYDVKSFTQYQQVLEQAMNEEKILFLVVYENGDDFYRMQKDDVFSDPTLVGAYGATIPMAVDIYSDMGSRLAGAFGIEKLPSFLYITHEEALVLVKEGYLNVGELNIALREAQKAEQLYATLQKKYAAKTLTSAEWLQLIQLQSLNAGFNETKTLAIGFLNGLNNAQLLSQEIAPTMATYGIDLEFKYPKFIVENRKALADKIDYKTFYESAYSYNFDRAVASEDTIMLENIVKVLTPNSPDVNANKEELAFETRKVFASEAQMFTVWKRAALERIKSVMDDSAKAEFLFEEAFEIADNFNSKESNRVARQLAEAAGKIKKDFSYKALEAYMAYLNEDYEGADALVKEAQQLASNASEKQKASNLQAMIVKELNKASKKLLEEGKGE